MHLQKNLKKISAYLLIAALSLPLLVCAPTLETHAATSGLYGSGSADEINIIKILDMALNRGGLSMSSSTIQSFLDYWWNSVSSDLNACIGNASTSITTTQSFVDYLYSALEDAEHYDTLGSTIKKYIQFCLTMEYKSLNDFKQLLLQPDTFRSFLLSYITDEDGNIAGTVDNKIKRYNLKNELVNMVRKAADSYIEEYEGYYLVKTFTINDLTPTDFTTKDSYDETCYFLKNVLEDELVCFTGGSPNNKCFTRVLLMDGLALINSSYSQLKTADPLFSVYIYNDNWVQQNAPYWTLSDANEGLFPDNIQDNFYKAYSNRYDIYVGKPHLISNCMSLFTKDGRAIKIWKSLDAFKNNSAGKSDIYYSKDYSGYDETKDNSVTFSGAYYNGDYSHDTIQNTIDNSTTTIDESTVNNIVNNYITNNNYGSDTGGSGSGSGSGSSGGWWNIGDGIAAIIEGIASLLDFLLKLIGDLIGLLGTFLTSILDVLSSLVSIGGQFGDFIAESFKFIPHEWMDLMFSSIAGICIAGIVRALIK